MCTVHVVTGSLTMVNQILLINYQLVYALICLLYLVW
ncbi:unnamed protein product [Arabidopsis halleri]